MRLLGIHEQELRDLDSYHTVREMVNQPNLWLEGVDIIKENHNKISSFMHGVTRLEDLKVYLVGAGSSAKAASIVEVYLRKTLGLDVYAISSTNLITQFDSYVDPQSPVLLVSFGSSGNTTEGLHAVELFKEKCSELYQILIVCSSEGEIIRKYSNNKRVLYIPIPKDTKGKSMAATGEFTLLVQYALMILDIKNFDYYHDMFNQVVKTAELFFDLDIFKIHSIANKDYEVIAALGSNALFYLASEMCLKISELSSGYQSTQYHSVLEFRHGPKLIMNSKSLVSFFISQNPLTKKYELDMLKECYGDRRKSTIVAVSVDYCEEIDRHCDYYIYLNHGSFHYKDDSHTTFLYALYMQSLAILKSINLGIPADTLGIKEDGFINKVAQGVILYKE